MLDVQCLARELLRMLILGRPVDSPHWIAQLEHFLPRRVTVRGRGAKDWFGRLRPSGEAAPRLALEPDITSHEQLVVQYLIEFVGTADPKRLGRCKHCGHYFYKRTRHRAAFCEEKCRYAYHNHKRQGPRSTS
jgi:hypothetical protein